jgi:hypothetical protein
MTERVFWLMFDWSLAGFIVGSVVCGVCGAVAVIILFLNTLLGLVKGG